MILSINRPISEKVGAPRTGFVKFPHGASFGEPGNFDQHMNVLRELLVILQTADKPGEIVDLPFQWRKTKYELVPWDAFEVRINR